MDYVFVSVVSFIFGACVATTLMAVLIAGGQADDKLLGDRQYNEE